MGGISFYYSPLTRLQFHLRQKRATAEGKDWAKGTWDPTAGQFGVMTLPKMHPDDVQVLRDWIKDHWDRLDPDEKVKYAKLAPEGYWEAQKKAARNKFLFWAVWWSALVVPALLYVTYPMWKHNL